MTSRNLRNKSGKQHQPISLTGRVLRSASRDHSANNSLTEENLASLVNTSPQTAKVKTKPTASSKSTPKPRRNLEPVQHEKKLSNGSSSSDDIDFSIVDPKLSSRKSIGPPKVTLRSTKSKVSQRKPQPRLPQPTLLLSDSDFDEQKIPSFSKTGQSSKTASIVQFEPQSPKVVLHKLNLEGLHGKDARNSNRKLLDSSSSSSSESDDDDEEDESSCSSDDNSSVNRDIEHPINLQIPLEKDKRLQVSTDDTYSYEPNESSYNYEAYFLANTRIKFKNEDTSSNPAPAVPNDCRKGVARKPRKGKRGLGGANSSTSNNIPICPIDPNFSVSKEAAKAVLKLSQQSRQINTDSDSEDNEKGPSDQTKNDHSKEVQNFLKTAVESQFPRWILLMSEGFNIIVHGFGSKIPVFDRFKKFIGDERLIITVNGLYTKLNPRSFLVNFCDALDLDDPIKVSGTNLELLADHVVSELMEIEDHPDVFFLLMNFDHIATNYPKLLNVLCTLAKLDWIHILASCDHLNASLGLTHAQSSTFNFCWFPCSTFHPYRQELRWNPNVFGDQVSSTSEGTKQTLQYVLKSLTTNARKAFTILASMQLAIITSSSNTNSSSSSDDIGVDFSALLRRCRESFIAHSDAALKALLVEFIDHKLISQGNSKSSKAIGNKLMITLDRDTLKQIADDKL